jgi:carbamoyltransferase
MGNAFLAGVENGNFPEIESFTPYTGRSFSIIDTESILKENKISYTKIENSTQKAAELLAKGSIIGWMQNEAEIGARALGNRSILANPAIKGMKEKINATIKHREHFRPFCPSVLEEDFSVYFSSTQTRIPYMNITVDCKEVTQKKLPEIVHANQTARVQTVSSKDNEQFHLLLLELKKQTGHGVVLNTSLNVRNQPMAYDVNDALITFFTSGLDALFIGNILLEK